jgi:(E)-4-hydroxy-3-methylbut-2-enyl-diphosphate synthase
MHLSPAPVIHRRPTRQIHVGTVAIGGNAPVSVQSMTNTDTRNAGATLAQINELAARGCDLIRLAVPDKTAASKLPELLNYSPVPLIGDIHFNADLALAALDAGIDGIRINPGTLASEERLKEVAQAAASQGTAVRIGINSGSLEKHIRDQFKGATVEAMTHSAETWCKKFEDWGCTSLKVSLKSSSVLTTVQAYRHFSSRNSHPLHLGVTEAGTFEQGTVKSSVGIGSLLLDGIGDTIRVSLTAPPVREVDIGARILASLGLRDIGPDIVTCPTCGRTEIDLFPVVDEVEREIARIYSDGQKLDLNSIAIMGCVVNGPGEARDADLGVAGGRGNGVLFINGEVTRKLKEDELAKALIEEIHKHIVTI